jgi:ribosomal protein S18 acetylase RimI-like enzyme
MISVRDGISADAAAIGDFFKANFTATFGHLYSSENLETFLARFTREFWLAELIDPRFAFRVAELDGAIVGTCKVGPMDLPVDDCGEGARELHQIYLAPAAKGTGLADELMHWTYAKARELGGDDLYLSVFTDNHRARRFYERHGFEEVGPYAFMVGDHADDDIIMRRPL